MYTELTHQKPNWKCETQGHKQHPTTPGDGWKFHEKWAIRVGDRGLEGSKDGSSLAGWAMFWGVATLTVTNACLQSRCSGVGKCPFLGIGFTSPKQISVANSIPNSRVMWNIGTFANLWCWYNLLSWSIFGGYSVNFGTQFLNSWGKKTTLDMASEAVGATCAAPVGSLFQNPALISVFQAEPCSALQILGWKFLGRPNLRFPTQE